MTAARKLIINPKWCKGCGICVAFCPKGALELGEDGKISPKNDGSCVLCGLCEQRCPDYAIWIEKEAAK